MISNRAGVVAAYTLHDSKQEEVVTSNVAEGATHVVVLESTAVSAVVDDITFLGPAPLLGTLVGPSSKAKSA